MLEDALKDWREKHFDKDGNPKKVKPEKSENPKKSKSETWKSDLNFLIRAVDKALKGDYDYLIKVKDARQIKNLKAFCNYFCSQHNSRKRDDINARIPIKSLQVIIKDLFTDVEGYTVENDVIENASNALPNIKKFLKDFYKQETEDQSIQSKGNVFKDTQVYLKSLPKNGKRTIIEKTLSVACQFSPSITNTQAFKFGFTFHVIEAYTIIRNQKVVLFRNCSKDKFITKISKIESKTGMVAMEMNSNIEGFTCVWFVSKEMAQISNTNTLQLWLPVIQD